MIGLETKSQQRYCRYTIHGGYNQSSRDKIHNDIFTMLTVASLCLRNVIWIRHMACFHYFEAICAVHRGRIEFALMYAGYVLSKFHEWQGFASGRPVTVDTP